MASGGSSVTYCLALSLLSRRDDRDVGSDDSPGDGYVVRDVATNSAVTSFESISP